MTMVDPDEALFHASAVCHGEKGLLILGDSGSGKSSLALRMIAFGARLVSDDQTLVRRKGEGLYARSPARLSGLIEARYVGILRLPPVPEAKLDHVVKLGIDPKERLPGLAKIPILGVNLSLTVGNQIDFLAASLISYLIGERAD